MSLSEKVRDSIERLKAFEPRNGEGYYLAFSGGKDSVVCKRLLDMSGLKYDAHYSNTGIDPPELVRFVMDRHPDVAREYQTYSPEYTNRKLSGKRITMWNLIPEKRILPTKLARYCCEYLKESGGDGRKTVTGVRWAESTNRKLNQGMVTVFGAKAGAELSDDENFQSTIRGGGVVLVNDNETSRRTIEVCYKRHKTLVNPIIDWTDEDVWDFIKSENIPYCGLYDEGFTRIGCIGCPMATARIRELGFLRWPGYKKLYIKAIIELQKVRKERNLKNSDWSVAEMWNWWMGYDILRGQMSLLEENE